MSQSKLELAIDAATGSISRIEMDHVNPTKETLGKIIEVLDLSAVEASHLYGMDTNFFVELLTLSAEAYKYDDIKDLVSNIFKDISDKFKFMGITVFLVKDNKIRYEAMSSNKILRLALSLLPFAIEELQFDLTKHKDNLIIKAVLTNRSIETSDLVQIAKPLVKKNLAKNIQKITGVKNILVVPIENQSKVLGVLVIGKKSSESYADELPFMIALSANLSHVIEKFINS